MTEVNHRGNAPGTGTPEPVRATPEGGAEDRGLVAGPAGQPEGVEEEEAPPVASAEQLMLVLSQEAVNLVRETGQPYCVASGCDNGVGGGPFKAANTTTLRTHLRAKHPKHDESLIVRTTEQLIAAAQNNEGENDGV